MKLCFGSRGLMRLGSGFLMVSGIWENDEKMIGFHGDDQMGNTGYCQSKIENDDRK